MSKKQDRVFTPCYGTGLLISNISTSGSVTTINPKNSNQAVLTNTGDVGCYALFTTSDTITVGPAHLYLPPNNVSVPVTIIPESTKLQLKSAVTNTTTNVHVIFGNGY